MSWFEALILGLVQGLTEFIPVSSSGHLVIAHEFLGVTEAGLTFDVALHLGTLLALVLYFYKDVTVLAKSIFVKDENTRLAWLLAVATVPAVIVGILLESAAESAFRSVVLVSFNLIAVALIMLYAESYAQRHKNKTTLKNVSKGQALTMGIAQALAIVPGISRSGSTITAGIFTGLDRVAATRFSFLLGIPIIFGAVLKVLISESAIKQISSEPDLFFIGVVSALLSGLFAIGFLLKYLAKHSLAMFAYYRIAIAVLTLLITFLS